jgi:hypothetical protein
MYRKAETLWGARKNQVSSAPHLKKVGGIRNSFENDGIW